MHVPNGALPRGRPRLAHATGAAEAGDALVLPDDSDPRGGNVRTRIRRVSANVGLPAVHHRRQGCVVGLDGRLSPLL